MASPIERIQRRTASPDEQPRVIDVNATDADAVLDALSSDTGRSTYRALFDEPGTASEIADRLDTSLQNTHYHLSNLRDAGLVEEIDVVYSAKGNEMTVYGPANDPLVLVGDDARVPRVERSLSGVVGGLGVLAVASLLVQWGAERLLRDALTSPGSAGPSSYPAAEPVTGPVVHLVFDVLEPGMVFFVSCLAIAAVAVTVAER